MKRGRLSPTREGAYYKAFPPWRKRERGLFKIKKKVIKR
jgi:hypothetical protein